MTVYLVSYLSKILLFPSSEVNSTTSSKDTFLPGVLLFFFPIFEFHFKIEQLSTCYMLARVVAPLVLYIKDNHDLIITHHAELELEPT